MPKQKYTFSNKQLCGGENRALDPWSSDYCAFHWFSDLGLVLNPSGPQSSHFSNGEALELKGDAVIFQKHLPAGMVLLDQWTLLWLFAQASVLWDTFLSSYEWVQSATWNFKLPRFQSASFSFIHFICKSLKG